MKRKSREVEEMRRPWWQQERYGGRVRRRKVKVKGRKRSESGNIKKKGREGEGG